MGIGYSVLFEKEDVKGIIYIWYIDEAISEDVKMNPEFYDLGKYTAWSPEAEHMKNLQKRNILVDNQEVTAAFAPVPLPDPEAWSGTLTFLYDETYVIRVAINQGSGLDVFDFAQSLTFEKISLLKGDIRGDGVVNLKDMMAVIDHIFNIHYLEGDAFAAAQKLTDSDTVDLAVLLSIVDIIFGRGA